MTAVTGGLSTLSVDHVHHRGDAARPGTLVDHHRPEAPGVLPRAASTLSFTGTWSDGSTTTNSGTYSLSANPSCGTPAVQTIDGQILLCNNGNPTKTNVPGGTIGATGARDGQAGFQPHATDGRAGGLLHHDGDRSTGVHAGGVSWERRPGPERTLGD